jgi:excinuclease ABC subunit C
MMEEAANQFEFEKADYYKRKIDKVKEYKRKNTVVSPTVGDVEVLTVMAEGPLALVNHFKVKNGSVIRTHAFELKRTNQEEESEILQAALGKLLNDDDDLFHEIVTNVPISDHDEWDSFKFTVPQIGDKKHLVDLSLKNCKLLLTEKLFNQNFKKRKTAGEHMVEELQQVLHLKAAPDHIECVDNSNFHGTSPVASLVVFKNGKASKRDYRHFNIKTVEGPDDFASMYEVVTRRFTRLMEEEEPLPKLFIVDGGKGQLSSAVRAMKDVGIYGQVPIIGIAKRLEEIYVPGDSFPLYIDKKSGALRLIQQMRDEAHRFAITHHRNRRSKAANQRTGLVAIKGIGEAGAKDILRTFKSVKKLKAASEEELIETLGPHKAGLILKAIEEKII